MLPTHGLRDHESKERRATKPLELGNHRKPFHVLWDCIKTASFGWSDDIEIVFLYMAQKVLFRERLRTR